MKEIPQDGRFDSTLVLRKDPYGFIQKHAEQLGSDVFVTRLLLRKTICMTGPEASQLFSDPQRFKRKGATPLRLQKTLFGRGGVQNLDDAAHRHRKELLLSLMVPGRVTALGELTHYELRRAAKKWQSQRRIELYPELQQVLARAVCAWAGVPLLEQEVEKRTAQLSALFDYAAAVGRKYWRARRARVASERWMMGLIEAVRSGELVAAEDTAIKRIALHRELNGELLKPRVAAVELLNVLRPTVAVSVYLVFLVHAMRMNPDMYERLQTGDAQYAHAFVQEVRRFYPFFPATPARVRNDFEWKGYHFPANTRVMLDLHGVNHDPEVWRDPHRFRPERFGHWDGSAFNFIPQGTGDHLTNHRCPGEWLTIEIMKRTVDFFVHQISFSVPPQDLEIDYSRLPALPRSQMVLSNVRLRG